MPYGIATSNCTTALHLALVSIGIGPGDEVICPDLTFISPVNMVSLCGATPVLVDVQPDSWGIDPDLIEASISPRTKALIVVHPFGHAADMSKIMEICNCHGIPVIEDVAEAPDATCLGQTVGTFGVMSCYSFFANKIMTTGEGGMILCRDPDLNKRLRILRDHGMSREQRYKHEVCGYNYRMTNMQAAVGVAQLERLQAIQQQRKHQDTAYRNLFAASSKVAYRPISDWCEAVHWLATITLPNSALRDPLLAALKDQGIEGRPMVYPVHHAKHFAHLATDADMPVTTEITLRSLHLPSSLDLSADNIERIANIVLDWLESQNA